ncbi:MAG TPA: TIGR02452 family protein [Chitinophagales bacterium]|nr:TIGR02452 family protein [Chitinophagales bacterium]
MNNKERIDAANTTLQILEHGYYTNRQGTPVSIKQHQLFAEDNSMLYKPEDFDALIEELRLKSTNYNVNQTAFEVTGETTLEAIQRLTGSNEKVIALNFASAKNPGGGFLSGSQAQEESLARSSGLYNCLLHCSMMYTVNRKLTSCFYTDHMIYSPAVPFFKNDDGELLNTPYYCSILTAPAVNAGAVQQNEPHRINEIEPVMYNRTEKLLAIAAIRGYETLILGAWGCGVFRNNPEMIAECFHQHLLLNPLFKNTFKKVVFAILDKYEGQPILTPFKTKFTGL